MPPTWLTVLAWLSLAASFLSAGAVSYDIYGRGLRQPMRVMEAVWPITAPYLGPFGWLAYARLGRPSAPPADAEWTGFAVSGTHCGAGCALGDVIGEWVAFATAFTIAGVRPVAGIHLRLRARLRLRDPLSVLGDQADGRAQSPSRSLGRDWGRHVVRRRVRGGNVRVDGARLRRAVQASTPGTNHAGYWLMLQIAMAIGLVTTYPVQIRLIRRGVKHAMGRRMLH